MIVTEHIGARLFADAAIKSDIQINGMPIQTNLTLPHAYKRRLARTVPEVFLNSQQNSHPIQRVDENNITSMKRSWAYIANGFRSKLSSVSTSEKEGVRRAAEDFFRNPPQHLPIVEAKDSATSSAIEVCKIVQTAHSLKLITPALKRPKVLEVAGKWLLDNGYEAQSVRALATVLSCLNLLEQYESCDHIEYAHGRVTVLRSAFQLLLQVGEVDKETGSLSLLLTTAASVHRELKALSAEMEVTTVNCDSDEDFFNLLRHKRASTSYFNSNLCTFLSSQLPSAISTFLIQHKGAWLSLGDGITTLTGTLGALPAASQKVAWEAVLDDLQIRISKGSITTSDVLSLLDAVSNYEGPTLTEESQSGMIGLIESVVRWISQTAASDISSIRDIRRLFHYLSQLYGGKVPFGRGLDPRELYRLVDALRPRVLQIIGSPNTPTTELSMFCGALSRCQAAILSRKDAASSQSSVIHVDVIRALVTSMSSTTRGVHMRALAPFLNAISQIISREWQFERPRRALASLLVPRKSSNHNRVAQPAVLRLLKRMPDVVVDDTTTEQLVTVLGSTLRLQSLILDDDLEFSLIEAILPVLNVIESRGEEIPANVHHLVSRIPCPLLDGLRAPVANPEPTQLDGCAKDNDGVGINGFKRNVEAYNGSLAEAQALFRSYPKVISSATPEEASQLCLALAPLIAQHTDGLGVGDLSLAFSIFEGLGRGSLEVGQQLAKRAAELVGTERGNYASKGRLLSHVLPVVPNLDSESLVKIMQSLSVSVSSSLLEDTAKFAVDTDGAASRIALLLPPLSSLALSATKVRSVLKKGADLDDGEHPNDGNESIFDECDKAVEHLMMSIANAMDTLYSRALEVDTVPEALIEVSGKGIPPLISALQSCSMRHPLHFTLLADLQTLLRDVGPRSLFSVLKGFSKVGVWNKHSISPICESIEKSIGESQGVTSLRSTVQLLFNMAKSGLISSDGLDDDAVSRLVNVACRKIEILLNDSEISLNDRQTLAMMALQPFVSAGVSESAEKTASELVWAAFEEVGAVEVFIALGGSQRVHFSHGGFSKILARMHALGLLTNLRPHTLEASARFLRFARAEGVLSESEVALLTSDLCTSFQSSVKEASLNQCASVLHTLSFLPCGPSVLEDTLAEYLQRFENKKIPPAAYCLLLVAISNLQQCTAVTASAWIRRLAEEYTEAPTGDAAAAALYMYSLNKDLNLCVETLCQSMVSRRRTLTPVGAVWSLAALVRISKSNAGGTESPLVISEMQLTARAAVVAIQTILSMPFDLALEGTLSSKGSGLCPPDSPLGAIDAFGVKGCDLKPLVGSNMGKLLDDRVSELHKRASQL